MRQFWIVPLLVAALCLPRAASAWNRPGHMLSAAIAYKELSPGTRARVVQLLRQHPHHGRWQQLIQRQNVPPADRDQFLFMQAARWPDDIRSTSFHHGEWHYINHPYIPPGQPPSVQSVPPDAVNLVTAFRDNEHILRSAGPPPREKAIALCWLFHLTGDVHQPLHATRLLTTRFRAPVGDRGGTLFWVRTRPGGETLHLHGLWDDLLIGSDNYRQVDQLAITLRRRPDLRRATFPELVTRRQVASWAKPESYDLARLAAYRNGAVQGSTNENNGEPLPPGYLNSAKPVAERRIVLAGYRLADLLKRWFPGP